MTSLNKNTPLVGTTGNGTHFRNIALAPKEFKVEFLDCPDGSCQNPPFEHSDLYERFKAQEHSKLANIALRTIHNFVDLEVHRYDMDKNELYISLYTKDSSYDLNAFYQELTKQKYIIK